MNLLIEGLKRKRKSYIRSFGRVAELEKLVKKPDYESLVPLDIAPGWQATAEVNRNSAGALVVTKLVIEANSETSSDEGLAANVLRSIKINKLVDSAISDQEYINYLLIADSPYDWAEETRITWMAEIYGEWPRQGRKPNDESLYAKMAFFYSIEVKENPTSPLQTLAEKLNVDRATVARRIDTARKLGLLNRPVSNSGPSGKAGGTLTQRAYQILGFVEEGDSK